MTAPLQVGERVWVTSGDWRGKRGVIKRVSVRKDDAYPYVVMLDFHVQHKQFGRGELERL